MTKLIKSFILGLCFTVVSSGAVFANGGGIEPMLEPLPADTVKMDEVEGDILIQALEEDAPDSAVSHMVEEPTINEDILNKQKEIDQYLFEEHIDDIEEKGFTVTHTVPTEEYVEIGITPFSDENAQYLYSIFGENQVKVVEGEQAELYTTTVADSSAVEAELVIANEDNASKESPTNALALYGIGAILIGGFVFARRKMKTTN
jgi:hypothetical protein